MLNLKIYAPTATSPQVVAILRDSPAVSALAVQPGAAQRPVGDVITADIAREAANDVVDALLATGVHRDGAIHLTDIQNWISRPGFDAEANAPGEGADAVVWADVVQDAYEDSTLTWAFLSFMVLSTLLASIAIVLDSQILVIAAMVLGPEFGAVAALGLALVRRRGQLFRQALRTLVIGFAVAIAVTTVAVLLGRLLGWVEADPITLSHPGTDFIYSPDKWSFLVALLAGAAGVLAITSARAGGLVGVFISVTTIPAAGNIAVGLAFLDRQAIVGSAAQLVINLTGMALAGWATLAFQQFIWHRVSQRSRNRRAVVQRPQHPTL